MFISFDSKCWLLQMVYGCFAYRPVSNISIIQDDSACKLQVEFVYDVSFTNTYRLKLQYIWNGDVYLKK